MKKTRQNNSLAGSLVCRMALGRAASQDGETDEPGIGDPPAVRMRDESVTISLVQKFSRQIWPNGTLIRKRALQNLHMVLISMIFQWNFDLATGFCRLPLSAKFREPLVRSHAQSWFRERARTSED
ncbi:hypothetical protein [Nitrobacter winogradskyi]|uniref:Uncharacterized protein n=2 Tax=Nitrobacter winogradskyi TaxID=913 RepID=A0ACC6AKW7_NITWI|nr:hypothetical protein [Nitrobacter winogradskyi]MCP2000500.1 hypothetical protein [Nitrobacter winogradskyi]GEC14924.1 hypothetical protein NWI01_08160 [Nitrobacter winogradskyi]